MPNSDGEVRVEITGDSSKIKKELKETEAAVKNTAESISEMTDALENTTASSNGLNGIAENADSAAKSISKAANETDNLGDSIKDEAKAAEKAGNAHGNNLNPQIEETGKEAEESGEKVSGFGKKLETAAKIAKIGAAAIGAAATGISAIAKSAVENFAEYEQLVGGVETLFKDSADIVQGYAAKAYETAGLSANQYMETVTSFSASLLQSLGGNTEAAAQVADKAIRDMADNANKMGTDMQSIQNAYQGFAKANYTMLDNLKLGYGGTKEEMQRLLEDAEKFSGIKYDLSSYADIVEAIHVIQGELEISGRTAEEAAEIQKRTGREVLEQLGTTAKESSTTIQGSLFSVKAAWQNLVTGIADENADFGALITNFTESAATALDNLLPRVKTALEGIGKLVTELSPVIAEAIPELVDDVLPNIVQAAVDLVTALVNALVDSGDVIVDTAFDVLDMLVDTLIENAYKIADGAVAIIQSLVDGLSDRLPDLIPAVVEIISEIVKGITDNAANLFMAALELISALAEGLIKAIPELLISVNDICENVYDSFVNYDWDSVGVKIIGNVAQGMVNAKKLFDDAVNTVIRSGANTVAAFSGGVSSGSAEHGGGDRGGTRENPENKANKDYGETYGEYMKRKGEQSEKEYQERQKKRLEQETKDYDEALKAKVAALDRSLTLRDISEEEYYEQLGEYLTKNQNLESDEYYKQLDKYNKYLDKKQDAADKAAEQQLKAEKSAAEKLQKEAETAAKKLLSEQEKIVEGSLSNIIKQFQKAYDELEKKRENYKKKLLSIGGDIFSVEEIEKPDGTKVKQYTVNNIEEQIKAMRQYNADIAKLKKQGASSGLLEELTSLSDGDSQQFAKYLSEMTDEEFKQINEAYAEKQRVADELSKELYADEYAAIADGINTALDEVSAGAADKGKEAAESYAKAFGDTLLKHSEDFYPLLGDEKYIKWFGNSGDTPNLLGGDMEKLMKLFMGSDFADIAAKVTSTVRSEQARYSAPAYTAAVVSAAPGTTSSTDSSRKSDITAILEKLNKPIQVMLDKKVIAEAVMTYQNNYMRGTGG